MHSLTTPARLMLGALLAAGLLASSLAAPTAAAPDSETTGAKPAAAAAAEVNGKAAAPSTNARYRRYYGAIYYSYQRDAVGYSYDYGTASAANRKAYKECRKYAANCVRVITFYNSCAALAARYWSDGRVRNYDSGWHRSDKWEAVRQAKKRAGTGSKTRTYVCTTRYR